MLTLNQNRSLNLGQRLGGLAQRFFSEVSIGKVVTQVDTAFWLSVFLHFEENLFQISQTQ